MKSAFNPVRPKRLIPLLAGLLLFAAPAVAQEPAAAKAGTPLLLVLNKADATLSIINPVELKEVGRVATGLGPHEVAVTRDGKQAIVANYGDKENVGNSLSIIDLETRKEVRRVELNPLMRPHGLAEAGGKVYFTAEVNRAVGRFDPATGKVDWLMGGGQVGTHMVVAAPDGKKLYTANIGSNNVTVFDLNPGAGPKGVTQIAVGQAPEGLDLSPDGKELWVGHNKDGGISIIDTTTLEVKQTLNGVAKVPIRVRFTPDGNKVLVSDPVAGELIVFDARLRTELKRIPVGEACVGVVVAPDSRRAFVAVMSLGRVIVIDLEKLEPAGTVETGQAPDGMVYVRG